MLSDYGLTEEQYDYYSVNSDSSDSNSIFLFLSSIVWLSILILLCIEMGWPEDVSIVANAILLCIFGFGSLFATFFITSVGIAIWNGIHEFYRNYTDKNYRNYKEYRSDIAKYNNWWRKTQIAYWRGMDGIRFEREIALLYSKLGYKATLTSHSNDQGVDIFLKKEQQNIIVQCKAHNKKIGPAVVRELYGTLIDLNADMAILATLEGVSSGAKSFIKDKPIEVISVYEIIRMQEKFVKA